MKNLFNGLSGLDKKLVKYIIGATIFVICGIIILIILKITIFGKIPVEKLEGKMESAAMNYFADHEKSLPAGDKDVTTVTLSDLINNGYLKSLDKLLKDQSLSCSGEVTVTNNAGYYLYSPNVNCGEAYKTKRLYEVITDPKNIVTSKDGLYQVDKEYVYRGEKVNNYLKFDGQLWRILRVNSDNSIKLINVKTTPTTYVWDNRYNSKEEEYSGINDYEVSRIKDSLNEAWKEENVVWEENKKFVATQDVCTGAITENETDKTRKKECSKTAASKQSVVLPIPSDYILPSIDNGCSKYSDPQCTNYNYMMDLSALSWSTVISANSSKRAFAIGEKINSTLTYVPYPLRFVIDLSKDTIYSSGNGSEEEPFTIKGSREIE